MTPIFRRIRKQLAADGKVAKYMRYAIGEIILVVIGILIAIQINTWRKGVATQKLERTYLVNLRSDLEIQEEINLNQIGFEKDIIAQADSAMLYLEHKISSQELLALLNNLGRRHTMVSNMVSFDMMLETGNANFIGSADILESLVRYKQFLDYATLVVNNNNIHLIDDQYGNFVNGNPLGFAYSDSGTVTLEGGLSDEERFLLMTQLASRKDFSMNNMMIVDSLNSQTEKIILRLDEYLNKN